MSSKILKTFKLIKMSPEHVLCLDSGLMYKKDKPEIVEAVLANKVWYTLKKERYQGPGWGNSSRGDFNRNKAQCTIQQFAEATGYGFQELNLDTWDLNEYVLMQEKLANLKTLKKTAKKLKLDTWQIDQDLKNPEKFELYVGKGTKPKDQQVDPFTHFDKLDETLNLWIKASGFKKVLQPYTFFGDKITIKNRGEDVVLAVKMNGEIIVNAQEFRTSGFERFLYGDGVNFIQKKLLDGNFKAIPFNVLLSAGLSVEETRIVDRGPQESFEAHTHLNSATIETRHFMGALLLENKGKYFLMDLDRQEIKHKIWNVFFSEVPMSNTIAEAYENLKPEEVKNAETNGTEVLRQGEWFFVPTGERIEFTRPQGEYLMQRGTSSLDWNARRELEQKYIKNIQHGRGRPNRVFLDDSGNAFGFVDHTGREHKRLGLGTMTLNDDGQTVALPLFKVVPNAAIGNFTITGDVD